MPLRDDLLTPIPGANPGGTEWGVDLVTTQLRLAGGIALAKTGIADARPRGHAIQLRINMETMTEDGSAKPGGGTLTGFEPPSGPVTDYAKVDTGTSRLVHGGSWLTSAEDLAAATRYQYTPALRNFAFGFRCARNP